MSLLTDRLWGHTELKEFFSGRVVRCLNRLPREVMNVPAMEVFKARLDEAWSNLV